jgi:hypothetical protein
LELYTAASSGPQLGIAENRSPLHFAGELGINRLREWEAFDYDSDSACLPRKNFKMELHRLLYEAMKQGSPCALRVHFWEYGHPG